MSTFNTEAYVYLDLEHCDTSGIEVQIENDSVKFSGHIERSDADVEVEVRLVVAVCVGGPGGPDHDHSGEQQEDGGAELLHLDDCLFFRAFWCQVPRSGEYGS